jgi:virginiamycin B lyase
MSKRMWTPIIVVVFLASALSTRGRTQDQGRGAQPGNGVVRGDDAPVPRVAGEAAALPAGPGKEVVQAACAQCHGLQQLSGGHDAGQWQLTLDRMISAGAKVPPAEVATVAAYLAKNFPEKPLPPAIVIPGPANVVFHEWTAPTRGSRPHDPFAAADGSLWYSGMYANVLGRVDVKTGAIKEFPVKIPGSGPHGLVGDKDGNIWFTANSKGYIGRLDPKTGDVKEYKLPAGTLDPHTPLFDQQGILWFTAQNSNIVGRLDPKTGEVKVSTPATADSKPYGMVISSKGVPFYVAFGTNKIGSIDPQTMKISEYTLPNPATRPRRIAITSDDVIWYADYSRGYLGRFDPKTGKATEYASPGGPKSQPYGITAYNDIIWYSEGNTKPNTLVRFDPKSEKFQSWAIPSGGGVVRNMMATREGNLVLAESGVNKVALVEVTK